MSPIIEIENITVHYNKTEVIKDISFVIEKGDYIGLTGPNGAGKTTLIKTILGLQPLTEGKINLFGKDLKTFNDWSKIGYLPQKNSTINALFPANVTEVVMLGLSSQKKWPKKIIKSDKKRANEILQELGIGDLRKRMLAELSGGQQQKVLLARAMVSKPDVLIFDEPSTALDPESRESFFQIIARLNRQNNITIILITHDTAYIGEYAKKLLYIDKSLIYFGDFFEFCKSEKMASYFGKYQQHLICHQHK